MDLERITRVALVGGLISLAGCTGYVEAGSGTPAAVMDAGGPAAAEATSIATASSNVTSGVWLGSLGSWCGPVDQQTLWLRAAPSPASCEQSSGAIYGAGLPAEGLTLELDAARLATVPASIQVPARYCAPGSATCENVQATLSVGRYAPEQGLSGAWSFTLASGSRVSGTVEANWCRWDDFLPAHPEAERLARDVRVQEVSVYQGVKVPIVRNGAALATRNADLVQGREALVRVFVEPLPGFHSRPIDARLTLQNEGESPRVFEQRREVSGTSRDADGTSTFNLELPKDALREGTQYSVELRETTRCTELPGAPTGARYPEQGSAPLGARATGPIKVMLVPVRYEADGSGRLPDTSAGQLARMAQRLYSMYPTTEVMLSVRNVVGTDRTDLRDMLDQLRELRDTDAPPTDLAYYGMVRQAETFDAYCQGTCTTGIAGFGSQNGTSGAGMGIGFAEAAANTFIHELGHIYRRPHAPCGGASAPDQSYPYPSAGLGSWGYDLQTHELFAPTSHVDFMSYCAPDWISDYNYQQILERIVVVNQRAVLRRIVANPAEPRTFRTLRVPPSGQASWGLDLHPQLEPPGDPATVKALDASAALVATVDVSSELSPDGEQAYFIPAGQRAWHFIQAPGVAAVPYAAPTQNKPFTR